MTARLEDIYRFFNNPNDSDSNLQIDIEKLTQEARVITNTVNKQQAIDISYLKFAEDVCQHSWCSNDLSLIFANLLAISQSELREDFKLSDLNDLIKFSVAHGFISVIGKCLVVFERLLNNENMDLSFSDEIKSIAIYALAFGYLHLAERLLGDLRDEDIGDALIRRIEINDRTSSKKTDIKKLLRKQPSSNKIKEAIEKEMLMRHHFDSDLIEILWDELGNCFVDPDADVEAEDKNVELLKNLISRVDKGCIEKQEQRENFIKKQITKRLSKNVTPDELDDLYYTAASKASVKIMRFISSSYSDFKPSERTISCVINYEPNVNVISELEVNLYLSRENKNVALDSLLFRLDRLFQDERYFGLSGDIEDINYNLVNLLLSGQPGEKKLNNTPAPNLTKLSKHLENLKKFAEQDSLVDGIYVRLFRANIALRIGIEPAVVAVYLSESQPEITALMERINTRYKGTHTLKNILAAIASCVACLTGLGIPFVLYALNNNVQERGHWGRFWSIPQDHVSDVYQDLECICPPAPAA